MRRPRHGLVGCAAAVLVVVALLSGCNRPSGQTPSATVDDAAEPVIIVAEEHRFSPATVSMRELTNVRLDNVGALAHTWTVMARPIDEELELVPALVLAEAEAEPGHTTTVDLSALNPGTYQVVCAIPGHFSAGMIGALVIGDQ